MIWIYWEQGSVPDSLAAAFHVFAGSEAIFGGQDIPFGSTLPGCFCFRPEAGESHESKHSFSCAELDIAKHTDLPDLLSSLGYTLKRVGNYYTTAEMDSIRIKERLTWRRYSTRQGGDAISFL